MIYSHKNVNKYLYHFTKASTAINDILPSNKLMAGSYLLTNDPKETKQWEFNIGSNENSDLNKYDMGNLSRQLSDALKSRTKVVCFSKDRSPLSGNHLTDIYQRGFCKPRMWAQYAEKHTGVCLVFDKSKLNEAISSAFSNTYIVLKGDVVYRNRNVVPNLNEGDYMINIDFLEEHGFDSYASAHFHQFNKRLFFEKMEDWSHEDELRWIVAANVDGPLFFDYQESLAGIVFGDSTDNKDIDRIIEITEYKIKYAGLKWKNCSPWYDLGNLKYDKVMRDSPWYQPTQ